MNTLPSTNNFWIILLISGFSLIFFGVTKNIEYYKNKEEYFTKTDVRLYELNEQFVKQKLIEKRLYKLIDEKTKTTAPEYLKVIEDFERVKKENKNKFKEFEILNIKEKRNTNTFKIASYFYLFIIISGLILFVIGLSKLMKLQMYRDKILYFDYLALDVKYTNCQSCNMNLVFDENFNKKTNYCSFCYTENGFTHKNTSLEEFNELVQQQLILKGFKKSEIKETLKILPTLVRWKKKFDWKK